MQFNRFSNQTRLKQPKINNFSIACNAKNSNYTIVTLILRAEFKSKI